MKSRVWRFFSQIGLRLMLFNCLLVFLPLAALLFLDVFETRMLESQENTMASQARVLAASLGAGLDRRQSEDAHKLLAESASSSLQRLDGKTIVRLRVLDADGEVLADSSVLRLQPQALATSTDSGRLKRGEDSDSPTDDDFSSFIYKLGSLPFRIWRAINPPPYLPEEAEDSVVPMRNPAVITALSGVYGSHTRVSSGQRSVTLYAAVPVATRDGVVGGVVLASQSTWRTLQTIYEIRRSMFQIFLVSLVAALALSFLLGLTISRPLRRMREMAEGFIDQWGRPTGSFRPVKGSDELADLSRSLVRLGDGLADHVHFIESFASDLAHELRNPLASIRAAAELLEISGGAASGDQSQLTGIIRRETERIDRLVALSRDLSMLDLAVGRSPRVAVDAGEILADLVRAWQLRGFEPVLDSQVHQYPAESRMVLTDPDFLRQALDKLVENALDFSPQAKSVVLSINVDAEWVKMSVADAGPGVSDAMKAEIFRRFHTERRESGHTGLGLSLAKRITEAFGGTIGVYDRVGGGAVFVISLKREWI